MLLIHLLLNKVLTNSRQVEVILVIGIPDSLFPFILLLLFQHRFV